MTFQEDSWWFMTIDDNPQQVKTIYDNSGICIKIKENLWHLWTIHDNSLRFIAIHGDSHNSTMAIHEYSWWSMMVHDSSCLIKSVHVCSWQFMTVHDGSWWFMTYHDSLWIITMAYFSIPSVFKPFHALAYFSITVSTYVLLFFLAYFCTLLQTYKQFIIFCTFACILFPTLKYNT